MFSLMLKEPRNNW